MPEAKRHQSPSTARNRQPILNVLQRVLAPHAKVLEIASGAGEHAVYFAAAMPGLDWQPSDPDADARASIGAWVAHERVVNVRAPIALDVRAQVWGVEDGAPFDAIVAINMIHIAPWAASLGLFAGAERLLGPDGVLLLYGPFMQDGVHNAPSNAAFDVSLKSRNAEWGVRDIADLIKLGRSHGLALRETVEMPANNKCLVFAQKP